MCDLMSYTEGRQSYKLKSNTDGRHRPNTKGKRYYLNHTIIFEGSILYLVYVVLEIM